MPAVKIPKSITKGEEVFIIPKEEYEAYLRWRKTEYDDEPLTPAEQKRIKQARQNFSKGEYYTWDELRHAVEADRRKIRS